MINALTCILLRFILLLRPGRDTLFDVIQRDYGRATIKDIFSLINDEKKKAKCELVVACPLYF